MKTQLKIIAYYLVPTLLAILVFWIAFYALAGMFRSVSHSTFMAGAATALTASLVSGTARYAFKNWRDARRNRWPNLG